MDYVPFRERRNFIRASKDIDVFCVVQDVVKWIDVFTVRAKNICRKGMFLDSEEIMPPGSEVYLQFFLPHQKTHFKVRAKVTWNRFDDVVTGIGVYFTDISPNHEEMIEHYVLKNYDFSSPSQY